MGHMNQQPITISVTQRFADGGTSLVSERAYDSPVEAKKAVNDALEREVKTWDKADDTAYRAAVAEAAEWDGRTPFEQTVCSWNRGGSLRFHLDIHCSPLWLT